MNFSLQPKLHLRGRLGTNNSNKPGQIMNKAEAVQIHPRRTSPDLHQFQDHLQESLQRRGKNLPGLYSALNTYRQAFLNL